MKNGLRSCVRISVKGKGLYRFINTLHSSGISCFGQYCRREVFYGEIYYSDLKKIEKMVEECSVELRSAEYDTLSSKLRRYRRRFGILAGVIAGFIGALYFSGVIVTIEIQGNSAVSDEAILSALAELDIKPGVSVRSINFHYCENRLRLMLDDISWAGIRHTGNRVVVQVTEIIHKPDMVNERVPCNVVSAKNAEITSVSVYDGMLMHKVGDYVPEGTLLISGVAGDDTGHTTIHHAMGVITGIYDETVTFSEDFTSVRYAPSESISTKRSLKLFSLEIPLYIGGNGEKSELSSHESSLRAFGKELPIGIVRRELTKMELRGVTYTEEELSDRLMEKVYLYEKNFLGEVELIDRQIETEKTDTALTYTVTYRLKGDIGEQRDIFIK